MDDCLFEYDDLVNELLDDESPFILNLPSSSSETKPEVCCSQYASTVFSGPTISDIENALPVFERMPSAGKWSTCITTNSTASTRFRPTLPYLQKKRMEKRYTVSVKCSEGETTDDGYKWRKYGQKTIKNSPYPRSYYRCTNPQCSAKKQVERSAKDPDAFVITYEGLHLHYVYPFLESDGGGGGGSGGREASTEFTVGSGLDEYYGVGEQTESMVFSAAQNYQAEPYPNFHYPSDQSSSYGMFHNGETP